MYQLAPTIHDNLFTLIAGRFSEAHYDAVTFDRTEQPPLLNTLSRNLYNIPTDGGDLDAYPWAALQTQPLSPRITSGEHYQQPDHAWYRADYILIIISFNETYAEYVEVNPNFVRHPDRWNGTNDEYRPGAVNIVSAIGKFIQPMLCPPYNAIIDPDEYRDIGYISQADLAGGRPVPQIIPVSDQYRAHILAWQLGFRFDINESY